MKQIAEYTGCPESKVYEVYETMAEMSGRLCPSDLEPAAFRRLAREAWALISDGTLDAQVSAARAELLAKLDQPFQLDAPKPPRRRRAVASRVR